MKTVFYINFMEIKKILLGIVPSVLCLLMLLPHLVQAEQNELFVNDLYGYQFECPEGMVAKFESETLERVAFYMEDEIALVITVFESNPDGWIGTKKSDELTMKERIAIELMQVCKPEYSMDEFIETVDWSFPVIDGEMGVQANGTSLEKCSSLPFPVTMVIKEGLKYRIANRQLDNVDFELVLSSFEFN